MSTKQTVQSIAIAIKNNYNQMRKSGKVILPASNKSVQIKGIESVFVR